MTNTEILEMWAEAEYKALLKETAAGILRDRAEAEERQALAIRNRVTEALATC